MQQSQKDAFSTTIDDVMVAACVPGTTTAGQCCRAVALQCRQDDADQAIHSISLTHRSVWTVISGIPAQRPVYRRFNCWQGETELY